MSRLEFFETAKCAIQTPTISSQFGRRFDYCGVEPYAQTSGNTTSAAKCVDERTERCRARWKHNKDGKERKSSDID